MSTHPPFRKVFDGVATREQMFRLFNRHKDTPGIDPISGTPYAGEYFEVAFAKAEKTCKWDMKVVYDDGESAVWDGLNLCQISKLTLKWNKNTGVTSAQTE